MTLIFYSFFQRASASKGQTSTAGSFLYSLNDGKLALFLFRVLVVVIIVALSLEY